MKVIKNTYPKAHNVPHAEINDIVNWEISRKGFKLIRESDNKIVFLTAPVDKDGKLLSNKKSPILKGVIAEIKSRGFILEIK